MISAELLHPADRDRFYRHLDLLLAEGVNWDEVTWRCGNDTAQPPATPRQRCGGLPQSFLDTCDAVLLHRDSDRFMRLHRMAQRLRRDPRHWEDVLHEDHRQLLACEREVRRDMHKMKAFVRFTQVKADDCGQSRYVAWFEPAHFIVQSMAAFFVRRFAGMRWAILTPVGSLDWDGQTLRHGPPASRSDAPPPDAGEALWLTYYASIFNPSRVKETAMRREMPVRYWNNLPEASIIPALLAAAPARSAGMIAHHECGRRRASSAAEPQLPGDALGQLQRSLQGCDNCQCAARATQAVAGEGRAGAQFMLVGEQPGDREDLAGRPFVGPAGQLLRNALAECGVLAEDCYFTNAVKHFRYEMRGKRRIHKTPLQRDIVACAEWLQRESSVVSPRIVLLLGRTAMTSASECWGAPPPGGEWLTSEGAAIVAVAHPSALLRAGEKPGSPGYLRWKAQIAAALGR